MQRFVWPLVDRFVNRDRELARLDEWWEESDGEPLNVFGRRRVGKSWLLRRFAHGKPALVLAAERLAPGTTLSRFAEKLAEPMGFRPDLPDVASLFRALSQLGREQRILVVVDEFPWLLPTTERETDAVLSQIQAVWEDEQGSSRMKLVLCGSHVGQMEALMSERNPLHGRLRPLVLRTLSLGDARPFFGRAEGVSMIERFAVSGGMPRYLSELAAGGSLRDRVIRRVLDRDGPLWDEARVVLEQELRQPAIYFSILEQLAGGEKEVDEIASRARLDNNVVSRYLSTLEDLRIVNRSVPVGAAPTVRIGHWRLVEPFFRFWFRFVFPYQAELEAGLDPGRLWEEVVAPQLADHVAPTFEDLCRTWVRTTRPDRATQVGSWWGNSLDTLRRRGVRSTEEIDVVGQHQSRVTLVGECRWRSRATGHDVLDDLMSYKIPALRQAQRKVDDRLDIVLFSKAGFTADLRRRASQLENVTLMDAATVAKEI